MKMKSKKLKQVLLIIMSLLIVLGSVSFSYAAIQNDRISPRYVNITNYSVDFSQSGIQVECTASLKSNKSLVLKIKMELQKEKSTGYETVETWTSSKTGTSLSMSELRIINIFSTYRLKVTFSAGTETEIVYKYL